LEGLRFTITKILVGIRIICPKSHLFPDISVKVYGRGVCYKLGLPASLVIISDAIAVIKTHIWSYLKVCTKTRGISLGEAFVKRLQTLDELVDFTIVKTSVDCCSYLPKGSLNTTKDTHVFICKTRIEESAGSDNILKVC